MITIYHIPRARSLRIIWLMEEIGEEYRIEQLTIPVPQEYLAVSPYGVIPAIDDDGIRMFEIHCDHAIYHRPATCGRCGRSDRPDGWPQA